MTDTTTEAVERLMKNVTPGPWGAAVSRDIVGDESEISLWADIVCVHRSNLGFNAGIDDIIKANAAFIAASRDLVPALLAERDALKAQLETLYVRVNELEWVKHPERDIWRCDSIIGTYKVFGIGPTPSWDFDDYVGETQTSSIAATIDAAKAAAQADYDARIRSALTVTHAGVAASQTPDHVTNADSCQPTRAPVSVQEAAKVLLNDRAALDRMVDVAEDIHCTGVSFNRVVGDALRAIAEGEKP